jgi:hypothetical protein
MYRVYGRVEEYTGFRWGNLMERDPWGDGRIILRWIFKKWDVYFDFGSRRLGRKQRGTKRGQAL